MSERVTMPNGVELYDPEDSEFLRKRIFDKAQEHVTKAFPMAFNGVRLELKNVGYADPDNYDLNRQKEALLKDEFLARRLRGTLHLTDDKTGALLDKKTMTLMRVPYLTERNTFVYNGSEFAHSNQSRLLPGAYSRRQSNSDLECQINTKPGTGSAFRVGLEPATAQYRLRVKGSNLHLYSLLKDLGVPDDHLKTAWGEDVFNRNAAKYDPRVLNKAYQHLVSKRAQLENATPDDKSTAIKDALNLAQVNKAAVSRTLPGILGVKQASAYRNRIEKEKALQDAVEFTPDLRGDEALDYFADAHLCKFASAFDPDLEAEEMQDAYKAVYGKIGPRLAAMKSWPEHWFHPGENQLGWIDWYMKYTDGNRNPSEDERQIRRWKSFKARHGAQFVKNPTPRRAFALRYWAIDPLKMLDTDEARAKLSQAMDDYKATMTQKLEREKNAVENLELPVRRWLASAPPELSDWALGFIEQFPA